MKFKNAIYLCLICFSIISCKTAISPEKPMSMSLREIIKDNETTFVDVRIPEQFEEKTAKGAINVPLATIENKIDFFKNQKKVILFCNKGMQAKQALEILKKNGVENVYYGKTLDNTAFL
jgi:rhodanese-related sulfurtransferase